MKNLYFLTVIFVVSVSLADGALKDTPSPCGCKCQNGRDGRDGREGVSIQGRPGRDGTNGQDGRDCVDCARGLTGEKGEAGRRGRNGAPGAPGPAGKKGPKGAPGDKGDKGDRGANGAAGDKGSKGDKGVCDAKVLATLRNDMNSLRQQLQGAKTESAASKQKINQLNAQKTALLKQVADLEKSALKVAPGEKIAQKLLPGGYSDYSVNDLQWHSLHLAAAAACKATSDLGGGMRKKTSKVFARSSHMKCHDVCKASATTKQCDSEVSIYGNHRKATSLKDEVGWFTNNGCNGTSVQTFEPTSSEDQVMKDNTFISFCCCRADE